MVKQWRDIWNLELSDIFTKVGLSLKQRMRLIPLIMNSQMMEDLEVRQEVIDEWNKKRAEAQRVQTKERVDGE